MGIARVNPGQEDPNDTLQSVAPDISSTHLAPRTAVYTRSGV